MRLLRSIFKFFAYLAVFLILVAGIMKIFFVDILYVGHNGMAPTMVRGERVLVWRNAEPEFGRIMLCTLPSNGQHVVGRVIGTPGREVASIRGGLTIGGEHPRIDWKGRVNFFDEDSGRSEELSLGEEDLGSFAHRIFQKDASSFRIRSRQIAEDRVYLLGDNRAHLGQDSRSFGDLPLSSCRGSVFLRLSPTEQSRTLLEHRYFQAIR